MVSYPRKLKCFSAMLGKYQIWQHFCSNDIIGQRRKGSRFLLKYFFEFMNSAEYPPRQKPKVNACDYDNSPNGSITTGHLLISGLFTENSVELKLCKLCTEKTSSISPPIIIGNLDSSWN
jgi:hypothetical protein